METITYMGKQVWPKKTQRKANQHYTEGTIAYYTRRVTTFIKWALVRAAVTCTAIWLIVGGYTVRAWDDSRTIEVQNIIVKESPKETTATIMARIADCESGGGKKGGAKQFNADGSIVTKVNENGTVDVGKYQINMQKAHIVAMAKLKLNPFTEEGNEAYAKYLYETQGTEPWFPSKGCWKR